jgi:hypothetical protein
MKPSHGVVGEEGVGATDYGEVMAEVAANTS